MSLFSHILIVGFLIQRLKWNQYSDGHSDGLYTVLHKGSSSISRTPLGGPVYKSIEPYRKKIILVIWSYTTQTRLCVQQKNGLELEYVGMYWYNLEEQK